MTDDQNYLHVCPACSTVTFAAVDECPACGDRGDRDTLAIVRRTDE